MTARPIRPPRPASPEDTGSSINSKPAGAMSNRPVGQASSSSLDDAGIGVNSHRGSYAAPRRRFGAGQREEPVESFQAQRRQGRRVNPSTIAIPSSIRIPASGQSTRFSLPREQALLKGLVPEPPVFSLKMVHRHRTIVPVVQVRDTIAPAGQFAEKGIATLTGSRTADGNAQIGGMQEPQRSCYD